MVAMANDVPTQDSITPSAEAVFRPTSIALFANHNVGLEVAKFLATRSPNDQVCALFLTGEQPMNDKRIAKATGIKEERIFTGRDSLMEAETIELFRNQTFDVIICVYWPWLLKDEIFTSVAKTINFHPAFLPINRGWFPHVHSLIDGSKTGVTLHKIEDGADTGPIWAQKEVEIKSTDTAKEIYDRLQDEMVILFREKWEDIRDNKLIAVPQDESRANYHAKSEIEELDLIEPMRSYKAEDLINRIRARSFGKRGFAYFEVNGERIYIKIDLATSSNFE